MVEDLKGNYRGKIIVMTDGGDGFKEYANAEHMISSIMNAFSVNKSKKLEMTCLKQMFSWLADVNNSTSIMR